MRDDDAGVVRVVDLNGNARTLTKRWISVSGIAWAPSGREIWFAASDAGIDRALRAVTLDGRDRLISSAPGVLRLLDIARNGRVLLSRDDEPMSMAGTLAGDSAERDLTWFDGSHVEAISADGSLVLFTESGEASGSHYWAYVHNQRTNSTTRIGVGRALALSPDGTRALAIGSSRGRSVIDPGGRGQHQQFRETVSNISGRSSSRREEPAGGRVVPRASGSALSPVAERWKSRATAQRRAVSGDFRFQHAGAGWRASCRNHFRW